MNLSTKVQKGLNELYKYDLFDDRNMYISTPKATLISICFERDGDGHDAFYSKAIGPGADEITLDWILNRINQKSNYRPFCAAFTKKLDESRIGIYPASFGMALVLNTSSRQVGEVLKDRVEAWLAHFEIEYSTFDSSTWWVWRYKFDNTAENFERINALSQ